METGTDFLARVADRRRRGIEAMKLDLPGWRLRERLRSPRPAGRLERALRRGSASDPIRLLCEIKRASPSQGVLRADLDPAELARAYERGGAAGISVVTEPEFFQGELPWIERVRGATALPILLKDFVVDDYQLLDAAVRGADGVLLIAALHSTVQLQIRVSAARLLGLDALVEVHDRDELKRAVEAGATLVGVNNRDLRTFAVDTGRALELIPSVPPLVTAVAESGIGTAEALAALRRTRCDAALMGEVLMTSTDPAATLATLAAAARG
ncbi:MAG TPA: indole-3-glycerol phosphate synthase TrpC [Terriglobales bacterium]|nr:indole-3-glycerol phosphate synthase TrpC [Terriglobales bacterium]